MGMQSPFLLYGTSRNNLVLPGRYPWSYRSIYEVGDLISGFDRGRNSTFGAGCRPAKILSFTYEKDPIITVSHPYHPEEDDGFPMDIKASNILSTGDIETYRRPFIPGLLFAFRASGSKRPKYF
jgi:hypothetical protein